MRILIDEAIPRRELFAPLGDLESFPGRSLNPAHVKHADVLLVRSVTRVDEKLLSGASIRFVGTATTGLDHIDTGYLASRGIRLAAAEGSNCRGVAEYVLTAIYHLHRLWGGNPSDKTLGIIGLGRIGSLLADWARACGIPVLACDPPLADSGVPGLVPFEELAAEADIISLHVPLTVDGPHPTRNLMNASRLHQLRPGTSLINTSRGEVVDESALIKAIRAGRLGPVVLDVWQNEPRPDPRLAALAAIATPHIAGYTANSKHRAAEMLAAQLVEWANPTTSAPPPPNTVAPPLVGGAETSDPSCVIKTALGAPTPAALPVILNHAVGLITADLAFRDIVAKRDPAAFDALRSKCAARQEFPAFKIQGPLDPQTHQLLTHLGFQVSP